MFSYYLRLARLSILRNPVISTLMVLALALGIGASMTTLTVYYTMSKDPIPEKSEHLLAVQLDTGDPAREPTRGAEDLPHNMTYTDASNLMRLDTPTQHKAAIFAASGLIIPPAADAKPVSVSLRATYRDFFPMFNVPFRYGDRWSQAADEGEPVIVLSRQLNEDLFAGENSVGKKIKMGSEYYTVTGVIDWDATYAWYDPYPRVTQEAEMAYLPLNTQARVDPMNLNGNVSCWQPQPIPDQAAFLASECVWVMFWAEVSGPAEQAELQAFLDNYASEQKAVGRHPRPVNNYLTPLMDWLKLNKVTGKDSRILVGLSFLFLLVCIINAVGLLIAKFFGKTTDVSVRRALGASRGDIFTQNLIEVSLIGVLGGILGLAFAWLGLRAVESMYRGYDNLVHLDSMMIVTAMIIALLAALLAGLYPSWRVSNLPPAQYLKTQ